MNVTKTYRSGGSDLVVFSQLQLEVPRGERLALVGESGAGKSSLLHLLGGLDRPTEGEIYFGQNDICRLSADRLAEFRNREVGFVWQIHSLLAEFTALENVMMPLLIRGQAREGAEAVALARLDEVGLHNRASHRAGELSGGEQQRVVLARALVGNPSVLLADEPTGNLDFRTGEMIMDLLDDLHRSRQLTSIHVTHNLNFARRADRLLALEMDGWRLGRGVAKMFERYTEKARRTIFFARYEASQFGSPAIETEHLLLGLLREDKDLTSRFLGARAESNEGQITLPREVTETQMRIASLVKRMENAIAGHDFKEARACADQERQERENLRQLNRRFNLDDISTNAEAIRREIEAHTAPREKVSTSQDLPLSHECKRVLAHSAEEAKVLKNKHIGTEHFLLGLLREEASLASRILYGRGLRLSKVRAALAKQIPLPEAPAEPTAPEPPHIGGVIGPSGMMGPMGGSMGRVGPMRRFATMGHPAWAPEANRVLFLARHEAVRSQAQCIETIHLLLALAQEKDMSERFLGSAESIRARVKPPPASREKVSVGDLPFSEECQSAFAGAAEEAAHLGQATDAAHLLLGIMGVESCAAAEILRERGLNAAEIRAKLSPPPFSGSQEGRDYV